MSERLDRIEKIVESNAKAIEALNESIRLMQREFLELRREANRRWEDNQADIRELQFENQRILRYLEGLVNRGS